jgi:hypothetical protein
MNEFPKSLTPSFFIEKEKQEACEREARIEEWIIKKTTELRNKPTPYTGIEIKALGTYGDDAVNKLIEKVRTYTNAVIHVIGESKNGLAIGRVTDIQLEDEEKEFNRDIKNLREVITAAALRSNRPEIVLNLGKKTTKAYNAIIKELEALGWDVEVYDKWSHINDDYSAMDLTLTPKK